MDSSQVVNGTQGLQLIDLAASSSNPDAWVLNVAQMTMNGTVLPNITQAQVITGFTNIGLPQQAWYIVCQQLTSMNPDGQITCENQTHAVPFVIGFQSCDAYNTNWNFTIQFGGQDLTNLMSGQYFTTETDSGGFKICSWNFENLGDVDYLILGEQFTKQFVTVFDVTSAMMAFGISKSSTSAVGPWIEQYTAPPAPTPNPTPSGTSTLAVVGITVGSLVVIGIIAFGVVHYMKKKKGDGDD